MSGRKTQAAQEPREQVIVANCAAPLCGGYKQGVLRLCLVCFVAFFDGSRMALSRHCSSWVDALSCFHC